MSILRIPRSAIELLGMSPVGTKRTCQWRRALSAFGVTADMFGGASLGRLVTDAVEKVTAENL
jgi:hypothetical protein